MCRWLKSKPNAISRILHSAAAIRSRRVVPGQSKAYRDAYGYLRDHIKHLDYVRYRRNHLPIGSGVTEARQRLNATWPLVGLVLIALVGCTAGLAIAEASGRLLAGMLYGVSPSDVPTLAGVVGIVVAVSILASLLPAIRASRLEPMQVLREG